MEQLISSFYIIIILWAVKQSDDLIADIMAFASGSNFFNCSRTKFVASVVNGLFYANFLLDRFCAFLLEHSVTFNAFVLHV